MYYKSNDVLMYYKYNLCIANFRRSCSYVDSPDGIKKKKATMNPKNKDDKLFQYEVTVVLNHK